MQLQNYLNLFLNNYETLVNKKARSKHTLMNIRRTIKFIEKLDIQIINIEKLIDIFNQELDKLEIKNNSKIFYYQNMNVFLKFLANMTNQNYNSAKMIKPKKDRNVRQAYSEKEMKFLESKLEEFNNSKFTLIWKLFKHNGLRLSEFAKINWEDLKQNNWKMQIQAEKGGNFRFFKVPEYLQNEMLNHNLFLSKNTIQAHFQNFKNFVKNKYPEFQKPIHAHMLRHFFATKAMINLGDIHKLQALTGHVNPNVLSETYIKFNNNFTEKWWDEANSYTIEALEKKELLDLIYNLKSQNTYLKQLLCDNNIKYENIENTDE